MLERLLAEKVELIIAFIPPKYIMGIDEDMIIKHIDKGSTFLMLITIE